MSWLPEPVKMATPVHLKDYLAYLLKSVGFPRPLMSIFLVVRNFYCYLQDEEGREIANPAIHTMS
jgi:hypothetical protein